MEDTTPSATIQVESDAESCCRVEEESRKAFDTMVGGAKLPDEVELRLQNTSGIGDKQKLGEANQDNPTGLDPPPDGKEDSDKEGVTNELLKDVIDALLRSQARREILQEALDVRRSHAPSTTALYCPKNGHPHSQLVDFGYESCLLCNQKLRGGTSADLAVPESTPSGPPVTDQPVKHPIGYLDMVKHSVEYLDTEGNFIFIQSQSKPFYLDEARSTEAKGIQTLAFEVHTTLSTSLAPPSTSHWYMPDINGVQQQDILNDPNVSVSVARIVIKIRSLQLIELLRDVIPRGSLLDPNSKTLELVEPFQLIAHHTKELEPLQDRSWEEIKSADGDRDGVEDSKQLAAIHLGMLMKFTGRIFNNRLEEERSRHKRGLCTFRMLWLLFEPGTTVYKESGGKFSAHVVEDVAVDTSVLSAPPERRLKPCVIELWHLDFDGRYVGRCISSVTVGEFEGERQITSLKVYPTKFVDDKDQGQLRQQLETRGRRWYELLRGGQVYHSGELPHGPPARALEGRIYIDPTSHYLTAATQVPIVGNVGDYGKDLALCPCEECLSRRAHPEKGFRWSRYDVLDPHKERDLTMKDSSEGSAHRYLLCAWETSGFVHKSRTWERVDIAFCSDHKPDPRAMDKLVMPLERKEMIQALVRQFSTSPSGEPAKSWGADFIESKGEGRVFLLHGSPGVGKTYTAECIAEFTDRALLSLTCADIGTDELKMESQLSNWFRLAEKWGAVMLIDEADVYLEQRSKTDLHRNSLVSVFLRCIEYYRGILFLTTNRVGHFDDAFVSRIHVILSYDELGEEQRRNIWDKFFNKLCDEREDFSVTKRAKKYIFGEPGEEEVAICKLKWNGREIRNVFQTAVALAEYRYSQKANKKDDDQPVLDDKDFQQVCLMTQSFKKYLDDVYGADEKERAFSAKARALEKSPGDE